MLMYRRICNGAALWRTILRSLWDLAAWKRRIFKAWPLVRIEHAEARVSDAVAVGSKIPITARVALGGLAVNEVAVEGYFGVLDSTGTIQGGESVTLEHVSALAMPCISSREKLSAVFCGPARIHVTGHAAPQDTGKHL